MLGSNLFLVRPLHVLFRAGFLSMTLVFLGNTSHIQVTPPLQKYRAVGSFLREFHSSKTPTASHSARLPITTIARLVAEPVTQSHLPTVIDKPCRKSGTLPL